MGALFNTTCPQSYCSWVYESLEVWDWSAGVVKCDLEGIYDLLGTCKVSDIYDRIHYSCSEHEKITVTYTTAALTVLMIHRNSVLFFEVLK